MCILILVSPCLPYACCYWLTWIVFDVFVNVYFVCIVPCCVRFRCVLAICLFHTHDLCSCGLCLSFSCEMVLAHFHSRNNMIIPPELLGVYTDGSNQGNGFSSSVFNFIHNSEQLLRRFLGRFSMTGLFTL